MATHAKAEVRLNVASERQLTSLLDALTPEAKTPGTRRTAVKIEREGSFLVLKVDAEDTAALRSALNAYLRWIGSAFDVIALVET